MKNCAISSSVGGCDGARGERNYFTDFATSVPDDCLILTLACGKYRFQQTGLWRYRRAAAPGRRRAV
ncbi:hypothetical protein LNP05_12425 [Klebsiella pneumoniae subsp. pneumoniae]|nr:hypothetical protein [Klebsiella pneumoniae subsp. pneumoniae]